MVSWLTRRRVPRWAAVVIVLLALAGAIGGFIAAAIPPLAAQTSDLISALPHYAHALQNHNSELGRLNAKYHLQQHLSHLLGDEIFTKVGGFVLGNVATSVITGLGTYLWMLAFGIPYPILLALFVALLDLIPVIGSTIGGAVVSLVALTVSLPVAIATLAFYIGYRLVEDYLLTPRIIGSTVKVPAVVSVVAVLVGGALLGIVGALVAIPVAAALRLLLEEIVFRRLDRS